MKKRLIGKTLVELKEITDSLSLPKFTAKQLADWLYKKRVRTIEEMTNLSKVARENISAEYEVGHILYAEKQVSSDGTKKYLFPTIEHGRYIESVMIPDDDRSTICISSQVGCKMNCHFCMTGRQGFHGNLDSGEIISQFMNIDEAESLTNVVYMGMGEPLDNWDNVKKSLEILTSDWGFGWSPRRITLSTIGIIPKMKFFLDESKCHLAVSLHNPFDIQREELMPIQKTFKIDKIIELIRQYDFTGQRRVSFEYIMFAGVNDSKRHADELIHLLRGLECRVNLIRFHAIPDFPLTTSPNQIMELFKVRLNNAGITTTIRASRGEDIFAACGLLAGING
ncbi:MAG: 23S rRNA (adenine(2503)-C(2))-methyltransferase RlmN [Bacteroidales bacterium]|jgi:23S rRNA (adenine2503-C2)-methyltransferase